MAKQQTAQQESPCVSAPANDDTLRVVTLSNVQEGFSAITQQLAALKDASFEKALGAVKVETEGICVGIA